MRGLSIFTLSIFILLFVTISPVFAHDEFLSVTFTDFTPYTTENYDKDPYKGNLTLTVTNNTGIAWGNFHFYIFDFGSYQSQAIFVDGNCGWGTPDCNPKKSPGSIDSWTIYNNGKNLDLFFFSNPVSPGETVTFKVYTDNTGNQQPFGIGFYPSVVPEPVSSLLFIIGSGVLGLRVWYNKVLRIFS
jgi:hypothetical protein